MISSVDSPPYWAPAPGVIRIDVSEMTFPEKEVSDSKAAITGMCYCLLFVVLVAVAIFIYVGTMEIDDSTGEGTDVDIIGGVGVGRKAPASSGSKRPRSRKPTSRRRTKRRTTYKTTTARTTTLRSTATFPTASPHLAAELLNASLNWNYAPCNDFYNFVCSRFEGAGSPGLKLTAQTKRAIKDMLATIDVPRSGQGATEKAAGLFRACIRLASSANKSEVESLKRFLGKLDLDISNVPSDPKFDILQRLMRLSLEFGFPTFVKFNPFKSHVYSQIFFMSVNKEDADWTDKMHSRYTRSKLVPIYRDLLSPYDRRLATAALALRIIAAEVIVETFMAIIRRTNPPEKVTLVSELGKFTKGYVSKADWVAYITNYTENTTTAADTVFVQHNATGLVVLFLDVARLKRNDARLLLSWSLLRQLLPLASNTAMVNSLTERGYLRRADPIPDFCYDTVYNIMGVAASQRYFSTVLSPSALESSRQVAMDVKAALQYKINQTEWIDDDALCMMSAKARNLHMIVGYPEGLSNESLVEAFYADFPDVTTNFFDPFVESNRLVTIRNVKGNIPAKFKPAAAQASYFGNRHVVVIFAGILQPPAFINNAPAAMKYGGLGQIAGHELLHAFDVRGIKYDSELHPVVLNNSLTMHLYTAKVLCLRTSYQEAESESRERTTDDKTDSEGLSDFAGIQLAYAAYRSLPDDQRMETVPGVGLTAEQTFFVSHCLNRCTSHEGTRRHPDSRYWHRRSRCIVPLRNMPEFARAFSCKPGDPMSPRKRCHFW